MRKLLTFGLFLLGCSKTSVDATADAGATAAASASAVPTGAPLPPPPPDVAAPPADAVKTASGLASKVLTAGTGTEHPGPEDRVKVHYTGWTKAGRAFDSSVGGPPATFGVGQLIKGWTEGLQLMVVGEKRRMWIPGALAYGDGPDHGDAPTGDLVFDVELLDIKAAPKPPPVAELKTPPADAKRTASGLAYKVLSPGKGTKHPGATDKVTVHYSGWTTDGKMFDSSVARGQPSSFTLNHVIKGWTEGVQLMVEGERTRLWIPSNMAYGDTPRRPGAPAGPLVFDVELVSIP